MTRCKKKDRHGWSGCWNTAKDTRYGVDVCRVHRDVIDRMFSRWGDEYVLLFLRTEWRQPGAQRPRLPEQRKDAA